MSGTPSACGRAALQIKNDRFLHLSLFCNASITRKVGWLSNPASVKGIFLTDIRPLHEPFFTRIRHIPFYLFILITFTYLNNISFTEEKVTGAQWQYLVVES